MLFYELMWYKKCATKYITKGKLESLLENFTAIFSVISNIIIRKRENSGNFTNSHSAQSSLRQKGFCRSFRANKMRGYFELRPTSALASKIETTKMEKRNFNIALKVLKEVSVKFPVTK